MIELADGVEGDGQGVRVRLRTHRDAVQIVLPPSAVRSDTRPSANDGGGKTAGSGEPDGKPCLFIRPEKIAVLDDAAMDDGGRWLIPGTVRERAYVGDHNEYLADISDEVRVRVIAPAGQNWPVGARIRLGVAPGDIVLYR